MCVLTSSEPFIWNISHSKKQWASYGIKYTLGFMQGTHYFCYILMRLEFSRQTSDKFSDIIFHENPFSESRVVQCGRTDRHASRHDEANRRFSQFCESSYKHFNLFACVLAYIQIPIGDCWKITNWYFLWDHAKCGAAVGAYADFHHFTTNCSLSKTGYL